MAIKVTFYNDVNFESEATVNKSVFNKNIKPDSGNFSDGGIYFTPLQNIMNPEKPAPAHIIQKSYIYTLGSYVINDPSVQELSITSANTGTTSNKLNENNCYVVTDITSDPYNKLLTVKKTNIKLGTIVNTVSNAASFIGTLGKQSQSINLGNYSLTVSISADGTLSLSNGQILADTITYQYQKGSAGTLTTFSSGQEFQLSRTDNYTLQFTTKTDIKEASITCDTTAAKDITFGDSTTKLSCAYHKNTGSMNTNIVKVTIPTSGWDAATYASNKYTFSVSIKTTGGQKENVAYNPGSWTAKITIAKTPSPLTLTVTNTSVTTADQSLSNLFAPKNDTDSVTGKKLGWKMTAMTANNVKSGWGSFDSTNQKYRTGDAYEMKAETITVSCTYDCSVNTYSVYHKTSKQGTLSIGGGKQWTLNFNSQGGDAVAAQSKYYGTAFSLPTTLNKQKNGAISYTFKGWYTATTGGTQVKSLSPEGTAVTWKDHAATLYAQWTETVTTKYYWYLGWDNEDWYTNTNLVTSTNGWNETTTNAIPSTYNKTNGQAYELKGTKEDTYLVLIMPENWPVPTLYTSGKDATYGMDANGKSLTINGVKYKLYSSVGTTSDPKCYIND